MKYAYRILAGLIAFGVVVQAASIAYGSFAISHAIDAGMTIDKNSTIGDAGFAVHGISGQMVIPVLAIALFIVSFGARVSGGLRWAIFVLITTIVQVALGMVSHSLPALGWLHGIVALVLFAVAVIALRLAAQVRVAEATSPVPGARTS